MKNFKIAFLVASILIASSPNLNAMNASRIGRDALQSLRKATSTFAYPSSPTYVGGAAASSNLAPLYPTPRQIYPSISPYAQTALGQSASISEIITQGGRQVVLITKTLDRFNTIFNAQPKNNNFLSMLAYHKSSLVKDLIEKYGYKDANIKLKDLWQKAQIEVNQEQIINPDIDNGQDFKYFTRVVSKLPILDRSKASKILSLPKFDSRDQFFEFITSKTEELAGIKSKTAPRRPKTSPKKPIGPYNISIAHSAYNLEKEFDEAKIKDTAATKIQAAWRGYNVRKKLKHKNAATKIQALARGKAARKEAANLRRANLLAQQNKAATDIQSTYKAYKAKKNYAALKTAVTKLQAQQRMHNDRSIFLTKKDAATKIQALARGKAARNEAANLRHANLLAQQNKAATDIQSTYKAHKARQNYTALKAAVTKLQAQQRMHNAKSIYLTKKDAAIKIQTFNRGNAARAEIAKLRQEKAKQEARENSAATDIQSAYKAHKARQNYAALKTAVTKLQTQQRMLHDKSIYLTKKDAATKIQALARGKAARNEAANLRHENLLAQQNKASTDIQSTYIAHKARQNYTALKTAVTKLQAKQRMHNDRSIYLTNKDAATKIQALARGKAARNKAQELRAEQAARDAMQAEDLRSAAVHTAIRNNIALAQNNTLPAQPKLVKQQKPLKKSIAIFTPHLFSLPDNKSVSSNIKPKKLYRKGRLQSAPQNIIPLIGGHDSSKPRIKSHEVNLATNTPQDTLQEYIETLNKAATKIQATYRGHKARQNYAAKKDAATSIQNAWKKYNFNKKLVSGHPPKLITPSQQAPITKASTSNGDIIFAKPTERVIIASSGTRGRLVRAKYKHTNSNQSKLSTPELSPGITQRRAIKETNIIGDHYKSIQIHSSKPSIPTTYTQPIDKLINPELQLPITRARSNPDDIIFAKPAERVIIASSGIRGRLVRAKYKHTNSNQSKLSTPELSPGITQRRAIKETNNSTTDRLCCVTPPLDVINKNMAATKIQAAWRGYQIRKNSGMSEKTIPDFHQYLTPERPTSFNLASPADNPESAYTTSRRKLNFSPARNPHSEFTPELEPSLSFNNLRIISEDNIREFSKNSTPPLSKLSNINIDKALHLKRERRFAAAKKRIDLARAAEAAKQEAVIKLQSAYRNYKARQNHASKFKAESDAAEKIKTAYRNYKSKKVAEAAKNAEEENIRNTGKTAAKEAAEFAKNRAAESDFLRAAHAHAYTNAEEKETQADENDFLRAAHAHAASNAREEEIVAEDEACKNLSELFTTTEDDFEEEVIVATNNYTAPPPLKKNSDKAPPVKIEANTDFSPVAAAREITANNISTSINNISIRQTAIAAGQEKIDFSPWIQGKFSTEIHEDYGNIHGYKAITHSFIIGFDGKVDDNNLIGFAVNLHNNNLKIKINNSKIKTSTIQPVFYFNHKFDKNLNIDSYLTGGVANVKSSRYHLGNLYSAKYKIYNLGGGFKLYQNYSLFNDINAQPSIAIDYKKLFQKSFAENSSNGVNIKYSSNESDHYNLSAGLNLFKIYNFKKFSLKPSLYGKINKDFLKNANYYKAQDNNEIYTDNYSIILNKLNYNLGSSLTLHQANSELAIDYNITMKQKFVKHEASLKAKINL